jgi:hypothetical protein
LKETISHFYVEQENGVQLEDLGRGSFGEDSFNDFSAIQFFQIDSDGSSMLIEDWVGHHLVDGDNDVKITYNMAVQSVRYTTGKNVKTVASNGLCTQTYRSKYVILTPSLNVLRSNLIQFKPEGPIQAALAKHPITISMVRVSCVWCCVIETDPTQIGLNCMICFANLFWCIHQVEKIWIRFSEIVWDDTKPYLGFANRQANGKATVLYNMNYFYRNNPQYNGNNVLLSFIDRSSIEQLTGGSTNGKLTREQVAVHIADLLQVAQRNGRGSVSWSFEMTNFKDDPKFLGAWESWQYGKNYYDFFDAIKPLNDKLFFAGSGHCSRYWGFTWGAIVSGATTGGLVADKVLGRTTARHKSPCNDGNILTNSEWRAFYEANPFFEP